MTERPYTDDDLRAEAARQHHGLTEDPDFMCIGERMEYRTIPSTAPAGEGQNWDDLPPHDLEEAQRSVARLLEGAADVSDWAINLGADGLEPDEHRITLSAGEKPIIRVHFAFAPEMSDPARTAFVEGLGAAAAREMNLALEEAAEVTIPADIAAHVLFQERLGGWPPSTFPSKLLDAWTSADTDNADRLAAAFPEYAAAIALMRSGAQGIEQLKAIADGQ